MRQCPKCGEVYADNDFRTMCASCMVSLVTAKRAPAQPAGQESRPISVGPMASTPEISLPEITLPTIEPRIPGIPIPGVPQPEPEPEPGPMPSPYTPQPNPYVPQPPLIPSPVPSPAPAPQRQPQPAPMPQPAPDPTEPGTSKLVRRTLTVEEVAEGKTRSVAMAVFAAITGLIGTSMLFGTAPSDFNFLTLLITGGMIALTVFLVRQAIYHSAIHHAKLMLPDEPCLGTPLTVESVLGVLRDLPITEATLTITAEERVVQGEGKSQTTYRHTIFTRTQPLMTPPQWPAGKEIGFIQQVDLPPNAPPSFSGRRSHIEWTAMLNVGIPSWYPDIRVRVPLTIPPINAAPPLPVSSHRYDLPGLDDLHAAITLECALGEGNRPVLQHGARVPFTLTIHPAQEAENQRVEVELVSMVSGHGNTDRTVLDRETCFEGGWRAGVAREFNGSLLIPSGAPITYTGTYLTSYWAICIRRSIPWHPEQRQIFEVLVIPATAKTVQKTKTTA